MKLGGLVAGLVAASCLMFEQNSIAHHGNPLLEERTEPGEEGGV